MNSITSDINNKSLKEDDLSPCNALIDASNSSLSKSDNKPILEERIKLLDEMMDKQKKQIL